MIVYAGKQFGNDFNNGDEGVFQDANRPRDFDKFKLRPGIQSEKWDWRGTNKNTDFSYIMLKGWTAVDGTGSGNQLKWKVPKLQEEWTQGQLDALGVFPTYMVGVTPEIMKMERSGNPYVKVNNGEIKYQTGDGGTGFTTKTTTTAYFEITKSGLYAVNCWGKFWFDPYDYSSSTSYQYKERVSIAENIDGVFVSTDMTQARACGNGDILRYMNIKPFYKGSQIIPMVGHSFLYGDNFVYGAISLTRLG